MFPNVSSVFLNWTSAVQMKVITITPVDFEAQENTLAVPILEMVIQHMSPQKVDRKPENERRWRWLDAWCKDKIEIDTQLQDPDRIEYRVQSVSDWSQGGFWHAELVQTPAGL